MSASAVDSETMLRADGVGGAPSDRRGIGHRGRSGLVEVGQDHRPATFEVSDADGSSAACYAPNTAEARPGFVVTSSLCFN